VTEPAPGPLAGLVVCDLSTVLAGPYCTMLLGDLGADVIKVEPPTGDPTRAWGPPWADGTSESAYYLSVNRNKRSLTLDLRTAGGREVVERLLGRADVLVENFRVGGLARLGVDDARLEVLNPRLVHLAISGYGTTGPLADRPGYDLIIQAASGLMSITGQPDREGGRPTKVGVAIADLATGMQGAVAVLAALLAREGRASGAALPDGPSTGRPRGGQRIDISLYESTISWLANQAANHLVGGEVPARMGNTHPNITPYESFPTADGEICVAVGSEAQWLRFCQALGAPDLAADPSFATNAQRVVSRQALRARLESIFRTRSSADWLARLTEADLPCGPVNDLGAVFAHEQTRARRMVETIEHPTAGSLRLPGIPFKLSATPAAIRRPPPLLGEHTGEVLAWLGYEPSEVDRLRSEGVV
jgi:crotonobetainyl-CoA:carnitine CoA-transferase CaiB-like acyl-CoA transferase